MLQRFFLWGVFLFACSSIQGVVASDNQVDVKKTASKKAKDAKAKKGPKKEKSDKAAKGKAKEVSKKSSPKEVKDKEIQQKPADATSTAAAIPTSHEKKEGEEGIESAKKVAAPQQSNKLPLPRFVSLKSSAVNVHVGPGKNYPIEWRYVKQSLPVEVIAEFDHWRQIRDHQGTVGWVHKVLLAGKRFVVVQGKVASLYASSDLESSLVATVEPGVIAKVNECQNAMCKVDIQGVKGWIKRDFLWGIYPHEQSF